MWRTFMYPASTVITLGQSYFIYPHLGLFWSRFQTYHFHLWIFWCIKDKDSLCMAECLDKIYMVCSCWYHFLRGERARKKIRLDFKCQDLSPVICCSLKSFSFFWKKVVLIFFFKVFLLNFFFFSNIYWAFLHPRPCLLHAYQEESLGSFCNV